MTSSPELTTFVDMLMSECVTTQEVGAWLKHCVKCNEEFTPNKFHPNQRHCSRFCQNHSARTMAREMTRELKSVLSDVAYRYVNRDRYIPLNFGIGTYTGPLNKSVTWVVKLAKDKGYHPMPINVHVRAVEPKFNHVTPEDVDWGHRQGRATQTMPRKHNTFCAACVDVVIDGDKRNVRVTKGVYLPIKHECGCARVYNFQGMLLEIKPL